jgi:hypothetical protein
VTTLTNYVEENVQHSGSKQAPTGVAVIGRIMLLNTQHSAGTMTTLEEAAWQAAEELSEFCAMGMNVYPLSVSAIVKRLLKDYAEFSKL